MEDRFYIDYRIGRIVKNLATAFIAPEFYNEVVVSSDLAGIYEYVYVDENDRYLKFSFTQLELIQSYVSFEEMLQRHFRTHDFSEGARLVSKTLYMTQEEFDSAYKEQ